MPHYSVATTKDKLSSLIDKALAGEEVIVTRRGEPTVEFRAISASRGGRAAAMARLRDWRVRSGPAIADPIPYENFYDWLYEDEG